MAGGLRGGARSSQSEEMAGGVPASSCCDHQSLQTSELKQHRFPLFGFWRSEVCNQSVSSHILSGTWGGGCFLTFQLLEAPAWLGHGLPPSSSPSELWSSVFPAPTLLHLSCKTLTITRARLDKQHHLPILWGGSRLGTLIPIPMQSPFCAEVTTWSQFHGGFNVDVSGAVIRPPQSNEE